MPYNAQGLGGDNYTSRTDKGLGGVSVGCTIDRRLASPPPAMNQSFNIREHIPRMTPPTQNLAWVNKRHQTTPRWTWTITVTHNELAATPILPQLPFLSGFCSRVGAGISAGVATLADVPRSEPIIDPALPLRPKGVAAVKETIGGAPARSITRGRSQDRMAPWCCDRWNVARVWPFLFSTVIRVPSVQNPISFWPGAGDTSPTSTLASQRLTHSSPARLLQQQTPSFPTTQTFSFALPPSPLPRFRE